MYIYVLQETTNNEFSNVDDLEKELAEIVIDTPPIILAEVSQKEQNNQQSNVWIQVPAEEQPKEEEVAPPHQSTKKKKKGGKKKQKKKASNSFLKQYDAFYLLQWGVISCSFAS